MVASQHFFCFITFTFYVFCQTKTVPKWQDPKQICLQFFFAKNRFCVTWLHFATSQIQIYNVSVLELYYIEWRHQLKVKYLTGPLLDACLQKIILSSAGGSDSNNSRRAYYTIQTNKHVFLQFCSSKVVKI